MSDFIWREANRAALMQFERAGIRGLLGWSFSAGQYADVSFWWITGIQVMEAANDE